MAARPDLVAGARDLSAEEIGDRRPVGARAFAIGGVLVAIVFAVVVSQFAFDDPDGLERVAQDHGLHRPSPGHAVAQPLRRLRHPRYRQRSAEPGGRRSGRGRGDPAGRLRPHHRHPAGPAPLVAPHDVVELIRQGGAQRCRAHTGATCAGSTSRSTRRSIAWTPRPSSWARSPSRWSSPEPPAMPSRSSRSRPPCSSSSWRSRGSERAGCSLAWPSSRRSSCSLWRSRSSRTGRTEVGGVPVSTEVAARGTWWPGRPWAQPRDRHVGDDAVAVDARGHGSPARPRVVVAIVSSMVRYVGSSPHCPHAHRDGVPGTRPWSGRSGPSPRRSACCSSAPTSAGNGCMAMVARLHRDPGGVRQTSGRDGGLGRGTRPGRGVGGRGGRLGCGAVARSDARRSRWRAWRSATPELRGRPRGPVAADGER